MPKYNIMNLNRRTRIVLISVLSVIVIALMGFIVFSQSNSEKISVIKVSEVSNQEYEEPASENVNPTTKASILVGKGEKNTLETKPSQSTEPSTQATAAASQSGSNTVSRVSQQAVKSDSQSVPQSSSIDKSAQSEDLTEKLPSEKEFAAGYNLIKNMLTNADKSEKEVLFKILNGIENQKSKIDITDGVIRKSDTDKLSDMFLLVKAALAETDTLKPTYTYYGNYYVTSLELDYQLSEKEISAQRSQLKSKVSRIMSKFDSSMSDFDKVLYFHDEIASYCKYTSEGKNINSAYGCLVEGKASCEGYAKAFLKLCDAAKLDCMIVTGKATANGRTVPHMWNKVKISGKWYNIDVCWDDTTDRTGIILRDYLNVSDKDILKSHEPDRNRFYDYPESDSENENYFIKNSFIINSESELEDKLKSAVEKALKENSRFASVRFSDKSVFEYSSNLFSSSDSDNKIFDILKIALEDTNIQFDTGSVSRVENSDLLTMTFILNY